MSDYQFDFLHPDDLPYFERFMESGNSMHDYSMGSKAELINFTTRMKAHPQFLFGLTAKVRQGEIYTPVAIGMIFFMTYIKVRHGAQIQFIVDPEKRGQGIEEAMVRNLRELATNPNYGKSTAEAPIELLDCELTEGSYLAQSLVNCGFSRLFKQDGYFKEADKLYAREFFQWDGTISND